MSRPEWGATDDCTWIPIVTIMAAIAVMFFAAFTSIKQTGQVNTVMYHDDKTYYIDSYTISGDYITAIDIHGQKMLFPKNSTVIKIVKE